MKMIITIAWRNIWRNPLRSMVVIVSIVLGIWAGVFVLALSVGLNNQRISSAISNNLSHIQIHNSKFVEDFKPEAFIPGMKDLEATLDTMSALKAFTSRLIVRGMISSPAGGYGVNITGINPEKERMVTSIVNLLDSGTYFEKEARNFILLSKRLSDKLHVRLNSKVILTFQDIDGNIAAGAFKVGGIYETISSRNDDVNVFVRDEDLRKFLGTESGYHEVAMILNDATRVYEIKNVLKKKFPELLVRAWLDINTELGLANDMMSYFLYIFVAIILGALSFGIVNTMLMAVLERKREIGMLLSIGMNRKKIFSMIVLETVFLSMVAGPSGLILAFATIEFFGRTGIDLSIVARGLSSFGVGSVVYPQLDFVVFINITFMIMAIGVLSSLYPAAKATKQIPAQAIKGL